jgi:hypothetical protein
LLFRLPPEPRDIIWKYSVAVRAPTDPPKCEAHFRKLPERKAAKGPSKSRSSKALRSKIKEDQHPFECTCPAAELPQFYSCDSLSSNFDEFEEQDQENLSSDERPFNAFYEKSEYPGILTACKLIRKESLAFFYNVNKFLFPGSHNRYQDREVMQWLLARREHLKHFHYIEWHAPTDEIGLRSFAVIIMLVELGILRGVVVRRSRALIDRYPMASDGVHYGSATLRPGARRFTYSPVVYPVAESLDSHRHILCELRLAVRERIQQKHICMTAVLHEDVEELEEMMSAVAAKFWRGCSRDWCVTPC